MELRERESKQQKEVKNNFIHNDVSPQSGCSPSHRGRGEETHAEQQQHGRVGPPYAHADAHALGAPLR